MGEVGRSDIDFAGEKQREAASISGLAATAVALRMGLASIADYVYSHTVDYARRICAHP